MVILIHGQNTVYCSISNIWESFFSKQELCLNIIPTFANLIEYPSMKNALIPRIKSTCLQTSSLAVCVLALFDDCMDCEDFVYFILSCGFVFFQVRVNSLVCLGKILEYLDKWYVIDEILPFLQQIPSREPAVLMGILGNLFFRFVLFNNFLYKFV